MERPGFAAILVPMVPSRPKAASWRVDEAGNTCRPSRQPRVTSSSPSLIEKHSRPPSFQVYGDGALVEFGARSELPSNAPVELQEANGKPQ